MPLGLRGCFPRPTLPVFLVFLSPLLLHPADPLSKIWEISLRDRLPALGLPPLNDVDIWSLRFSPDGRRLAILFGNWFRPEAVRNRTNRSYLAIVPVDHPETFRTDLTRFTPPHGGQLHEDLVWAPDGNSLVATGVLIRLPGGEQCQAQDWMPHRVGAIRFNGFLTAATAVVSIPNWNLRTFATVDDRCRIVKRWDSNRYPDSQGVSPDGTVLAVQASTVTGKLLLIKLSTRKEIELPLPRDSRISNVVFLRADVQGGELACTLVRSKRGNEITCWNAQTGKRLSRTSVPAGMYPGFLSAGGDRIAISGYNQQRLVWDLATDRVIASWTPENQVWLGDRVRPIRLGFAISPDGRLIADAVPGSVRLYRLP